MINDSSSEFLYGTQAKRTVARSKLENWLKLVENCNFLLVSDGGIKISRSCLSHRLVIAFGMKDNIFGMKEVR